MAVAFVTSATAENGTINTSHTANVTAGAAGNLLFGVLATPGIAITVPTSPVFSTARNHHSATNCDGAIIYRNFDAKGESKPTPLKPPKTVLHAALMRHFRECILGKAQPIIGAAEGVQLMAMLDGIYRSQETGKSVAL